MPTAAITNESTPKPVGKPWQPGQSGNPSGRPAVATEFREKCREFMSDEGWKILIGIAKHGTSGPSGGSNQLRAAELIAGYAYGKPVAMVAAADPDEGFTGLSITIKRGEESK